MIWNDRTWTWRAWDGCGTTMAGDAAARDTAQEIARRTARTIGREAGVPVVLLDRRLGFDAKQWSTDYDATHGTNEELAAELAEALAATTIAHETVAGSASEPDEAQPSAGTELAQLEPVAVGVG